VNALILTVPHLTKFRSFWRWSCS